MQETGLPWAVNLPDEWQQPYEKQQVHTCYPTFVAWVNSGGTQALNWY
ncbi:LruC domain-containing protein [uncultured Lamprocystis sp.]|nr:LruC domain-containing protein [uncultured Lamprocystis sp.]